MAGFFFDASALVKRYVPEAGSAWVTALLHPAAGNVVFLAPVTGAEVVSAIARRRRGGSITAAQAAAMIVAFRNDFASQYRYVDITAALIDQAMDLADRHSLRGYDAVQLAAALVARSRFSTSGGAFLLVSADLELNAAAAAEGLAVEDPNLHP